MENINGQGSSFVGSFYDMYKCVTYQIIRIKINAKSFVPTIWNLLVK